MPTDKRMVSFDQLSKAATDMGARMIKSLRVAIIGGGLQGVGAALEIALRGGSVDLFEKQPACLTRASLNNEGKVHLGYVYANDRSLATARLMARSAVCFERLLRRWTGSEQLALRPSKPFHYLVHRSTLMTGDELEAAYAAISNYHADLASQRSNSYFGMPIGRSPYRLGPGARASLVADPGITDVFKTTEIAIDPDALATLLRTRVAEEPAIRLHTCHEVQRATPAAQSVSLTIDGPEGIHTRSYDHVINASWDDLIAIDTTAGVEPIAPWSFRLKRFLTVRSPEVSEIPSATIVLGPFGDVANYGNGKLMLSWYPVGCSSWSRSSRHPPWSTTLAPSAAAALRFGIHSELTRFLPALSCLSHEVVASSEIRGGIIFALGTTDVDDPTSTLHERFRIGPRSFGRYHTIDTGKLVCAPLFAETIADRIMGR